MFHGVNAFRDGDDVVLDVCRFDSMFADGPEAIPSGPPSQLYRWRVDTSGETLAFTDEVLESERRLDLPTRDPRYVGRPYRYGWLAETRDDPDTVVFRGVVRRDFTTGALDTWDPGVGRSALEGLFVPDGPDEGDRWVLTYRYDAATDSSDLVVLDASDLAAGPVAEVALPQRVPYGFHATWVPA